MQVRIHIPSHSIFSLFIYLFIFSSSVHAHLTFLLWFFRQGANAYWLPIAVIAMTEKETRNVQTLKTLCLSGAPQVLPRIRVLSVLLRSQGIQDWSWGSHSKFSQRCTNNGMFAPSLLLHCILQILYLWSAFIHFIPLHKHKTQIQAQKIGILMTQIKRWAPTDIYKNKPGSPVS